MAGTTPPLGTPPTDSQEPEIHVIPERYYGAALKAKVPDQPAPGTASGSTGALEKPPKSRTGIVIVIIVVLVLLSGGAFVYFNQNLVFPAPTKPVPVVQAPATPPAPTVPTAPADTVATSTSPQSIAVSWTDTSSNESGFRLERAGSDGVFQPLTNLPPNSTSFLDVSVQASSTYSYRVIASNEGGDSDPSPVATATVLAEPPAPPPPAKLPPAGLDTDSDGLTDLEEALYNTNPKNPDSDHDGFLDGNEVFYLYNPNGQAPSTLLDDKVVKAISGSIGWSMQIPTAWTVDIEGNGASSTIDSGHGETFQISVEDNPNNLSIVDWYLAKNPGVQESQLLQYTSKKGYQGIIGADLLTTYIPWADKVFVFTYNLDDQEFINFRTTYSMMLNSLVLNGLPQVTPPVAGQPLPFEPGATTTGVIAQPVPLDVFPTPTTTEQAPSTDNAVSATPDITTPDEASSTAPPPAPVVPPSASSTP